MDQNTGKIIILLGLALVAGGLIVYFLHDRLHWMGRLPGDIRVERDSFRFYFPITTMILLSIVVTIAIWIIKKFL